MFLTGTTNIQAGNGETFTLGYSALATLAGTLDPYYAETAVYREVLVMYKEQSTVASRSQRKTLCFKDGGTTDQVIFSVKASTGVWILDHVLILDRDGGSLIIKSSDIPTVSSYDLLITA
jgi:hypothetical protein